MFMMRVRRRMERIALLDAIMLYLLPLFLGEFAILIHRS